MLHLTNPLLDLSVLLYLSCIKRCRPHTSRLMQPAVNLDWLICSSQAWRNGISRQRRCGSRQSCGFCTLVGVEEADVVAIPMVRLGPSERRTGLDTGRQGQCRAGACNLGAGEGRRRVCGARARARICGLRSKPNIGVGPLGWHRTRPSRGASRRGRDAWRA